MKTGEKTACLLRQTPSNCWGGRNFRHLFNSTSNYSLVCAEPVTGVGQTVRMVRNKDLVPSNNCVIHPVSKIG